MLKAFDLKSGNIVSYKENVHLVLKKEFYSPGPNESCIKLKLFNLDTGETANISVDILQEFSLVELPKTEMKLLHQYEDSLIFSDDENSELLEIKTQLLGEKASFLHEKSVMDIYYYNGMVVSVELPKTVVFGIDFTEDIEKDPSNLEYIKTARLNNGHTIKVPAFIKTGDRVRINTETGEYICRD